MSQPTSWLPEFSGTEFFLITMIERIINMSIKTGSKLVILMMLCSLNAVYAQDQQLNLEAKVVTVAGLFSDSKAVMLSWENNAAGQRRYDVYKKSGKADSVDGYEMIISGVETASFTDSNVQQGKSYTYYIAPAGKEEAAPGTEKIEVTISNISKIIKLAALK